MSVKIQTKFGSAKIDGSYWRITSGKEGNHRKLLHRLIFEEFYGKIPEGYVVHHKNGNKTDNCIMNLQLMSKSEHHSLHNKGRTVSDETRKKISENHADQQGEYNPMYGKHHSEESKQKMAEAKKGHKVSDEIRKKMSEKKLGENHPQYRHDLPSGEELLKEYEENDITQREMGEKYNCSTSAINNRIKKAREVKNNG